MRQAGARPAAPLRVGIPAPSPGNGWLGGVNYLRNLVTALRESPSCGVQPVMLAPRLSGAVSGDWGETARSFWGDAHALVPLGVWLALGGAPALERAARASGVDCVSHTPWLTSRTRLPLLPWIPDLQHRRLPQFFSSRECVARDRSFRLSLGQGTLVVVSSDAARHDVEEAYPAFSEKLRVLRFVSCIVMDGVTGNAVGGSGGEERFLLLPNQFWVHKNHAVVIEALGILRGRGQRVLVLATGAGGDYRNAGHYASLMRRRTELGVEDQFRVEGVVPYSRLSALMRSALAIINPSLFEGWSTTVEEAKSLGKRLILSDIPVHREQAPDRAAYFAPEDAGQLADVLWTVWNESNAEEDVRAARAAAEALPGRRRAFAETYAGVVREAVSLTAGLGGS